MLLTQTYANNISIDLDGSEKPILPSQFYPTPEKYITIQNSSGMGAKDYNLWQEIINLIHPILQKNEIEIVQIGAGEILPLNKTINLVNQTNFAQSVYVVQNALLHVGNDSWAAHAATETPVVILYGSTSVECHSPFYFNSRSKFINSHRWGKNPSFQAQEFPKSINLIDIFKVANEILNILEIPHSFNQKSILLGDLYPNGIEINFIPDVILDTNSIAPQALINIRADLFFDLNIIIENLKRRKCVLWLDREIDLNILKGLKPNIAAIVFEIQDDTDPEYLNKIIRLGIQLNLWTKMPQDDHLEIKLNYLDLPLVVRQDNISLESVNDKIKKYLNTEELPNLENIKYYSHKIYLSQNKIFLSLFDWKNQISVENIEKESAGDLKDQDFLNEINSFLLFQ